VRFTVREYRHEDFDTLWSIDQACFAPAIAYTRYELRTYMHRQAAFTLVAESGELPSVMGPVILGFVVGESSRHGVGHIITIDVRTAARRLRIGSALLSAAEERLRAAQCDSVRLETAVDNTSALTFYKRHGYDVTKVIPHYYASGVDALLLEKSLVSVNTPELI
jgi:ribosomal protein S18 acetylase RimI-like enzyme